MHKRTDLEQHQPRSQLHAPVQQMDEIMRFTTARPQHARAPERAFIVGATANRTTTCDSCTCAQIWDSIGHAGNAAALCST